MPPTASNPVKISVVFGIVWAFLAAFIVSNIGKASGYANPGIFVSLLSGLLTGAGIGTGSYYLFQNINTSVGAVNATAGKGSGGAFTGDWDNVVTAGYYYNQGQEREAQAIQGLTTAIGNLANFVPSATTCVPGINAAQINACTQAGFPMNTPTTPTPPTPPTPPTFAPGSQSCSAANLTADQLLQCIFSGNAQSGVGITDYQLQQLSRESGIPVDQLKTALQAANQASLQAAWTAAGGPAARPVPPRNPPTSAPTVSLPGTKSKMSPGVAAAIALPIGALAIAVMLYGVTKLTPQAPNLFIKGIFWGSLLTALMTTISAVGLGADTQIKFRKLNPKQQDERRKATYALAAVAIITAGITAALGIKYSAVGEGENPLWKFNGPDLSEENVKKAASLSGIMLITGSGVTGLGLAIDKGMNGKKRNPAVQKKRDIAMGVLLAISGVALLSGAAYKKQDAIKGAFANKYPTVTEALKAEGATFETVKPVINAMGKSAPPALKNATNINSVKKALNNLSLKGRATAALTTTAGLFKTDGSYSKTRVGSAVLLLASIIILAVLKSQKKLKPAPKPGKPAPPPKVAPGEIVMYVMIGLSVLIFTGSLVKDKFFPSAPAAPAAPVDPYKNIRTLLESTNIGVNRGNLNEAIGKLQNTDPVKIAYEKLRNTTTQAVPSNANLTSIRNILAPPPAPPPAP